MIKTFDQTGDFAATAAAERWLCDAGYSVGPMQSNAPCGIVRGGIIITKWRDLSPRLRDALDSQMTSDMRNGPVTIELFHAGGAQ